MPVKRKLGVTLIAGVIVISASTAAFYRGCSRELHDSHHFSPTEGRAVHELVHGPGRLIGLTEKGGLEGAARAFPSSPFPGAQDSLAQALDKRARGKYILGGK